MAWTPAHTVTGSVGDHVRQRSGQKSPGLQCHPCCFLVLEDLMKACRCPPSRRLWILCSCSFVSAAAQGLTSDYKPCPWGGSSKPSSGAHPRSGCSEPCACLCRGWRGLGPRLKAPLLDSSLTFQRLWLPWIPGSGCSGQNSYN